MKINLLSICLFILLLIPSSLFSQRGETGDKVFSNRFPPDVLNYFSEASLEIKNTVEHDIFACVLFSRIWRFEQKSRRSDARELKNNKE